MADIALVASTAPDGLNTQIDLAISAGDLATDKGLKTAVIVSLFSDRLANADDALPDNSGDRRGWWGDMPVGDTPETIDLTGSRLWLLDRAGATNQNARLAEHYANEALQWLIDDGIAASLSAAASWIGPGALELIVSIVRVQTAPGATPNPVFTLLWNSTITP